MPSHLPAHLSPLVAIDMGSNSFRYEIGRVLDQRYERIAYEKEGVRLGAGLTDQGLLTPEAIQRGLDCLSRFGEQIRKFRPDRVRAVATQTLREAKNRDDFLRLAEKALGFPIEIIPGREEARLIFSGVSFLQPSEKPRLVIDIGGRSTEMIVGQGRQPLSAESFQIGSVSLSLAYFGSGELTTSAFADAQVATAAAFEEALVTFDRSRWSEVLGSSGTASAVSQYLLSNGITDGSITPKALRWCMKKCVEMGHSDRLIDIGIKPDRTSVISGGLAILYTLTQLFHIDRIEAARGALRQGVIVDLHDRLRTQAEWAQSIRHEASASPILQDDVRDQTVQRLQQRYQCDLAQAERVSHHAQALFKQLGPTARLRLEDRRELGWAAQLHEIGMVVSHHDHHRHTAYLLSNTDAPGFSQSQQRRLAQLGLGQRGRLRKIADALQDRTFVMQCLCLRLAVILCNARLDHIANEPGMRLALQDECFQIKLTKKWSKHHPQTLHLLRQECQEWSKISSPWTLQLPDAT